MIAEVIVETVEVHEIESYWLCKNFYKFSEEIEVELPRLKTLTYSILEREDSELYK